MFIPIVLGIIVALVIFISLYVYHTAFYSPMNKRTTLDDPLVGPQYEAVAEHLDRIGHIMMNAPCEMVIIESIDGLKLCGRYYHLKDGAPTEILFHGYRSCAFRDCSGGHALSRKLGFNALVIDQRAHGCSEGTTITFGIKERQDCLCWIQYAIERFGEETPIILSGISMGATTVLMANGLDLPLNVACIIADSPYSSPAAIIEKVCSDLNYPVILCRPFIYLSALLFGHFHMNSCSAKTAVASARIPILLIHGEDDRLVPCSMSQEIAACCASPVTIETFSNAGHGLSYITDPLQYEKIVCDFLLSVPSVAGEISKDFRSQYRNPN